MANSITKRSFARRCFRNFTLCMVLFSLSFLHGCGSTRGGGSAENANSTGQKQVPQSYYAGYSKKFLPYRDKLTSGQVEEVQKAMIAEEEKGRKGEETDDEVASKLRLVSLMERSSLALQTGDADKSVKYCNFAQKIIEDRESESYAKEFVVDVGSVFVDMVGAGEYGRYEPPGYEKVLLLDIASMAYLLNGDDRAFNVARLAIFWQDQEKEKFEKDLGDIKKEEEVSQKPEENETEQKSASILSALNSEFSKYDATALRVPNAFVNPFGDYVTGMINEFKSVKIKSLMSNAHIAYKQALKLNPKSKVLKKAVADTKKKRSASRLIHVVALDGFVPEKKVLSIPIYHDLDVEVPTYEPIKSKVATIKVTTMKGKTLATLHPVANVDSLALRHQKDRLPAIQAMVVATAVRDVAIISLGDKLSDGLGGLIRRVVDSVQEPDTTCWMSLPSTILAARFYPPKGLKKLKIRSYNSKGKKIAEQVVKLSKGNHHFVLVRSIDSNMQAYPSKKIWSSKLKT